MKCKKEKIELIFDYITIKNIDCFCSNLLSQNYGNSKFLDLKKSCEKMIEIYKKLFFKLSLFSLSLAILEKEFLSYNFSYNNENKLNQFYLNSSSFICENLIKLSKIAKKLNLNEFELNYLNLKSPFLCF